ncbi:MAG: flagellar protein FlgN [Defluviitaleaceae bacterium]|nr:flagellar protein FlgN [Defluviitaleaceae bacterium]MCL2263986.1 flagellar protein FlgN [Defluviitaleaceae bacterium]
MAGMIDQLVDVMKQQTERHTELHGLSLEEKDAIIQNDIDTLQNLVNLKNMVISQNSRLEKQRITLVNDIAEVMGHKGTDLSLADVIDIMKDQPADQEKLREAGTNLKESVIKLKEANDINKSLLESSIEFVEYSLNALRSTLEPEMPEYPTRIQPPPSSDGAGTFNTSG